jgi:hypothetical protein
MPGPKEPNTEQLNSAMEPDVQELKQLKNGIVSYSFSGYMHNSIPQESKWKYMVKPPLWFLLTVYVQIVIRPQLINSMVQLVTRTTSTPALIATLTFLMWIKCLDMTIVRLASQVYKNKILKSAITGPIDKDDFHLLKHTFKLGSAVPQRQAVILRDHGV